MEQNGPSYYNKTTQQAYDSVSTLYSIENNAKQIKLLYTTVLKTAILESNLFENKTNIRYVKISNNTQ